MKNDGKFGSFPEELVPVLNAAREAAREPLDELTKLQRRTKIDPTTYTEIQRVLGKVEQAITPVLEGAGIKPVFRGKYVQAMTKEGVPVMEEDGVTPKMVLNVDEVSIPSTRILQTLQAESKAQANLRQ